METVKLLGPQNSLGSHGYHVFITLAVKTTDKTGHNEILVKFDLDGQGQSTPQNNRDLNQAVLHLWSKFSDAS